MAFRPSMLKRFGLARRVAALAATIDQSPDSDVTGPVAELIDLAVVDKGTEALAVLGRIWPRLQDNSRLAAAVVGAGGGEGADRWESVLGTQLESDDPVHVAAAAMAIGDIPVPGHFAVLPKLLESGNETIADAAERSLVTIAERLGAGESEIGVLGVPAITSAVEGYRVHRRRRVVGALLSLLTSPLGDAADGPVADFLADGRHGAHSVLRSQLRKDTSVEGCERAWRLLKSPTLADACLARLFAHIGADEWRVMSRLGHLAYEPGRAAALARLGKLVRRSDKGEIVPDRATFESLGAAEQAGCVQILSRIIENDEALAMALQAAQVSPHSLARLRAVVASSERDGLVPLRMDMCFDCDESVARSAAIASLPDIRPGGNRWGAGPEWFRRTLGAMTRHQHEAVRGIGRSAWDRCEDWLGDSPESMLLARRRLRSDRAGVLQMLRDRMLESEEAGSAIAAIGLARRLGVCDDVAKTLAHVVVVGSRENEIDPRVVASAAAALGDVAAQNAGLALESCHGSGDARVRANALEAVVRRARRMSGGSAALPAVVIEAKSDNAHRVRGSAVRAMLAVVSLEPAGLSASFGVSSTRPSEIRGVEALAGMLSDGRPMHRLAGLWVASRISEAGFWSRWGELCSRLAAMASADPEPAVRDRAAAQAASALASIRAAWSAGAGEAESD